MQLRQRVEAEAAARAAAIVIGTLPPRVDLVLYQGDDIFVNLSLSQPGIDLTQYTPRAQVRTQPGGTLIVEVDVSVLDATTLRLHLDSPQTTLLPPTAAWDVQVSDAAAIVTTLAQGTVSTTREVTTDD